MGEGGNAKVYRGVHIETGNQVAIKIMRELNESAMKEVNNEVGVMSQICHQNVLKIVAYDQG